MAGQEVYGVLLDKMRELATKYGTRVLDTKENPISIGECIRRPTPACHPSMVNDIGPIYTHRMTIHGTRGRGQPP